MALHKNRPGLDLPIDGAPEQRIDTAPQPRRVALIGDDTIGMKPTMHVREGDPVRRGQLLFEDKKTPGVRYTAPAEGKVVAVNRGPKRRFLSLVIELSRSEMGGGAGAATSFSAYTGRAVEALTGDQVKELLLESGAWPALRARPFGVVADPATRPHSVFVTATDSNPLAPAAAAILEPRREELRTGLLALTRLTDGPVFVCTGPGENLEVPEHEQIRVERFAGPHPAGTAGWHIHRLDPVSRDKTVWYLGLQDAIGIGHLIRTGALYVERVIALAGPAVRRPRLVRTRIGAATADLVKGELEEGGREARIVSGSVLSGRRAGDEITGYLGRYDQQVSVVYEGGERELLGWAGAGLNKYSALNAFVSSLLPGRRFALTTSTGGSERAILPIGVFEKVFPFDIPPAPLLRALAVHDTERCEELGCLELVEEDIALCTFVDPGKNEFGPHLREVLSILEREG